MKLRDRTFQKVFANLFVYNILFEDSEVDEQFLGIDQDSSVLGISGAGCRIAGHLSQGARSVDAVDINRSHLALTALKVTAAQRLTSYSTFYDLFARGWHPQPEQAIGGLARFLPDWVAKYWKNHYQMFSRSMLSRGLTAQLFTALRRMSGVDEAWLRSLIGKSIEERQSEVERRFAPVLNAPWTKAFLKSPLNLIALGVNYAQTDRILQNEQTDIVGFLLRHLKRVAATDLENNWFAWYAIAGKFNHDHEAGVPPYLRRDRHERSLRAPTTTRFLNANIFDVLGSAGRGAWSHYTLCDAPDWMPQPVQRRLFDEILRTSRDGGVVLYRSVEPDSLVDRLGLDKHFQLMADETARATVLDRTRQFRRIAYYRIVH